MDEQIKALQDERQRLGDDIKRQEGGILACDELARKQKEAPPDDDASEETDDND